MSLYTDFFFEGIPKRRDSNLFKNHPEIISEEATVLHITSNYGFLFIIPIVIGRQDQAAEHYEEIHHLQCPVCHEIQIDQKCYDNHMKIHKIWVCLQCDEILLSAKRTAHQIKCTDKQYRCNICSYKNKAKHALVEHRKQFHKDGKTGFVCEICDKTFKDKNHLQTHKANHNIVCENCGKQFSKQWNLKKHIEKFHAANSMSTDKCQYCDFTSQYKSSMKRHELGCLHKPTKPIVLTNKEIWKIVSKYMISNTKVLGMFADIKQILGKQHFEPNLRQAMKEAINKNKEEYNSEIVTFFDNEGKEETSTISYVRNVSVTINNCIKQSKYMDPRVIVSADAGQGKNLICCTIYDLNNIQSNSPFKQGGARMLLILCRADFKHENRRNWEIMLGKIKLQNLDRKFTIAADLKTMNVFMGIQSHGCIHNCYICTSNKVKILLTCISKKINK